MNRIPSAVVAILALVPGWSSEGLADAPKSKPKDVPVLSDGVAPGSKVTLGGKATPLSGDGRIELGKPLPETLLVGSEMERETLKPNGKVRFINIVPSLDTGICEKQMMLLGDEKALKPGIERITISRDLPFAQKRVADGASIKNVKFLSDYRGGELGRKLGIEIEANGLLARSVVVTDGAGIVRYFQIVPEIKALPDMEKAFAEANKLVK